MQLDFHVCEFFLDYILLRVGQGSLPTKAKMINDRICFYPRVRKISQFLSLKIFFELFVMFLRLKKLFFIWIIDSKF